VLQKAQHLVNAGRSLLHYRVADHSHCAHPNHRTLASLKTAASRFMFEDMILDGRNRYRACVAAGVEPTFIAYTGDDPVGYVISANLRRRHLDESQRAMVAARLATLKLGDNQHSEGLPIGRGSELLNVGERTVARAREVQEHGTPELVHALSVTAEDRIVCPSRAAGMGCVGQ
jgi:hypothetical protein